MGVIIFDNRSSSDYGINIEIPPNYEMAEKDYEIIHIPGRNGDVIFDNSSYKNVDAAYYISVGGKKKAFVDMANNISNWLHSTNGYARLEDSYSVDYYRVAMYKEAGVINNIYSKAGRISVTFNCKPQRFLKAGDYTKTFDSPGTIFSPTNHVALPIVTVNGVGTGVVNIGGYVITLNDLSQPVTIDSELQDAYSPGVNKNETIVLTSKFPRLHPGENNISFTGGVTSVEVIPKWWTI